jgi:hypothetical protein
MKWSQIGIAGALAVIGLSGTAYAGPDAPAISVARASGKATLVVKAGDLRFEETLTPSTFDLSVVLGNDMVRLSGNQTGDIEVTRARRTYKTSMTTASPAQLGVVRGILGDSPALRALQAVVDEARVAGGRYAGLLHSANALLRIVQGDPRATGDLVVLAMAQQPGGFRTIAQRQRADDCWDGYARAVLRYTYEYEACVREARDRWWEVYRLAWCAYEYDLKATLAGFWLLDCSGL